MNRQYSWKHIIPYYELITLNRKWNFLVLFLFFKYSSLVDRDNDMLVYIHLVQIEGASLKNSRIIRRIFPHNKNVNRNILAAATMSNESLKASVDMDDNHLRAVLSFFALSDGAPNNFSNRYPWILYFYFGICIHGFILNAFLVRNSIILLYERIIIY